MNNKHQPLLKNITENSIKIRYRCNVFYVENVHVNITQKHSIQQRCSKQLHSHVWTFFFIMEPFPHILSAGRVIQVCVGIHSWCTSG